MIDAGSLQWYSTMDIIPTIWGGRELEYGGLTLMSGDRDAWWKTKIIKWAKNKLLIRGYRIEELMGNIGYGELVYLLIMGELPHPEIARLMEDVLVAGADYGLLAPSVAASRMAATCGIPLNCCIATGVNLLGDIHGGASEQLMKLLYELDEKRRIHNVPPYRVVEEACQEFQREKKFVPGFGHPVHEEDPRIERLFSMAEWARERGRVSGSYIVMVRITADVLKELYSKAIPINVDGPCAAVQCEMKLPWECAKGLSPSPALRVLPRRHWRSFFRGQG